MSVFTVDVHVVEHSAMKRPPGAPDQLWGGPWFTPEVLVVEVEAESAFEARLVAAQMGHCTHAFADPYVVAAKVRSQSTPHTG
jgi:hypothetical protein